MSDTSVYVVDDSALMRKAMIHIIETTDGMRCVGEAENGNDAMAFLKENEVDFVLLDLQMPERDGVNVLRNFRNDISAKIIVVSSMISGHRSPIGNATMDLGADAVLEKPADFVESAEGRQKMRQSLVDTIQSLSK